MTKSILDILKDNPHFKGDHWTFEKYGYSAAVRAGGLPFIAGGVGFRPDGTIPESMADVVEVVSYHVDLEMHLPASLRRNATSRSLSPRGPSSASTRSRFPNSRSRSAAVPH